MTHWGRTVYCNSQKSRIQHGDTEPYYGGSFLPTEQSPPYPLYSHHHPVTKKRKKRKSWIRNNRTVSKERRGSEKDLNVAALEVFFCLEVLLVLEVQVPCDVLLCSGKEKEGLLGAGLLLLLDTFRGGFFFCCSTVAKGFFQTSSCFTVFCFSKDGSELLFRTFHLIRWRSRSSSSSSSVLASDILEWESSSRGEFGISSFFRMCCFGLLHWVSQAPLRIFHRLRRRRRHRIPSAQIPSNSYYNRDRKKRHKRKVVRTRVGLKPLYPFSPDALVTVRTGIPASSAGS